MSRVGNNPILVPEDVTIDVTENVISVKGKLGELKQDFSGVLIKIDNGIITVERVSESKENKSKHGLYRALINNMIIPAKSTLSEIYDSNKDDDGFLYIIYTSENTFG